MADFNATLNTLRISKLFLKSQTARGLSGTDVAKLAGVYAPTVYSILRKLEHLALLTSQVERLPEWDCRPPRRFYKMTEDGQEKFRDMLGELQFASS